MTRRRMPSSRVSPPFLGLFVVCLAAACTTPADREAGPDLRGSCWALELEGAAEIVDPEYLLPPLVLLDSVDTGILEYRRLSGIPESLPGTHRYAMWKSLPADSVEMVWSTGFSGWVLRMRVAGDTMTGTAEELNDAGDVPNIRSATAARIVCQD